MASTKPAFQVSVIATQALDFVGRGRGTACVQRALLQTAFSRSLWLVKSCRPAGEVRLSLDRSRPFGRNYQALQNLGFGTRIIRVQICEERFEKAARWVRMTFFVSSTWQRDSQ